MRDIFRDIVQDRALDATSEMPSTGARRVRRAYRSPGRLPKSPRVARAHVSIHVVMIGMRGSNVVPSFASSARTRTARVGETVQQYVDRGIYRVSAASYARGAMRSSSRAITAPRCSAFDVIHLNAHRFDEFPGRLPAKRA